MRNDLHPWNNVQRTKKDRLTYLQTSKMYIYAFNCEKEINLFANAYIWKF